MNVLVLFGGASYEHDVSVITGCITTNLLNKEYNIYPVYIDSNQNLYYMKDCCIEDFRNNKKGKEIQFIKRGFKTKYKEYKMDIAVIATHGINGEDGMSKALLDFYNIPSIGSSLESSAVNMDKYFSYCILKENEINVVKSAFITKNNIEHNIKYPIILKPARLGSSIGITIVYNEIDYYNKVQECFKYDSKILVQSYLENITEYNISLYKTKNKIVTSKIEEVAHHDEIYSYDDKYSKLELEKRKYLKNQKLIDEIIKQSIKTYETLELEGIVRIDYIVHDDILYLNEVNTIPGSLSYYLYDKEFKEIIKELINYELFKQLKTKCYTVESKILYYDYNMKK